MKPQPNKNGFYARLVGREVILKVGTEDLRIPVRGVIVGESRDSVRVRIGDGWALGICKASIRAMELIPPN